ncbi:MAG: DEAD/DEAH box helicase [Deferribacteraceae bacterium]|jgi:SNF2 family DNA or RNA helicase|nr:DEAD/DEAH box helicase [Deferribacteraceae bacterium]
MNIKEFLEKYGNTLKRKAIEKLAPLYQPKYLDSWDTAALDKLTALMRRPFVAQADTILSIAKGFYKADRKSLILVGEMGTGKTLMGIGISTLNPKKSNRTLIICPPHLVRKWAREIKVTDPNVADVKILESISDVELTKPVGREYWIVSKEKAKLHYSEKTGYWTRKGLLSCPLCGKAIDFEEDDLKKCKHCEQPLNGANRLGMRRYAIAEYVKRHKNRCHIDLLIADEVHELKGGDTAQGQALHALVVAADKTLAMTGTLMGGYASNLYHLLFRLFTRKMKAHGYKHNSSLEFSGDYGVVETVIETKERSGRTASLGKDNTVKRTQEKPGVSPLLLPHFLLEESAFLWIEDVAADAMPTYDEFIEIVPMEEEQKEIYNDFEDKLINAVKDSSGGGKCSSKLLGALVNSLYALPDGVRKGETVYDPDTGDPLIVAPELESVHTNNSINNHSK